jgi:hypothetical protein
MLQQAVVLGGEILSPQPVGDDQIQPASVDLRLGEVTYRVRASFLPGGRHSVRDKRNLLSMHRIDPTKGAVLERSASISCRCSNTRRCEGAPRPPPIRAARRVSSTSSPA